ncbi:unnamed protein product [Lathyrus sativus]|nr:unnamed protein product [Lathyrus sativus]
MRKLIGLTMKMKRE